MVDKLSNMLQIFTVGDRIGNYCNGFFGRDDYDNKTCIMVGVKFAVFVNDEGYATVLNWSEQLIDCVKGEDWRPE